MSLLKHIGLARRFLDSPKPLEYTDSFLCQLFDLSGLTDPLRDGLNLSSSLVLDPAFGQLDPLSSFCFRFNVFFTSLSSVFLSVCLLLSVHGFKAIRAQGYSVPLPPPSDRLLQLRLEFPIQRHHQLPGSGHMSSSKRHQPTSLVHFFSYVVDEVFLHHGSQTDSKSLLKHGIFLRRFCFLRRA